MPTLDHAPTFFNTVLNEADHENSTILSFELSQKSDLFSEFFFSLLPYLLIAGTVIVIAVTMIQNAMIIKRILNLCHLTEDEHILGVFSKCKRELNIVKEIPVYISPSISTPFLFGMFHYRLVLPNIEFHEEELHSIFLHELTHLKRHDTWINYLMLLLHALHWFNPLAYMARKEIAHYCELSCDEQVVKSMNSQERKRYCELILTVLWKVVDQRAKLFTAFSGNRKNLERRIKMILKSESAKNRKWVRVISITLTLGIVIIGLMMSDFANASEGEVNINNITYDTIGGDDKYSESINITMEGGIANTHGGEVNRSNITYDTIGGGDRYSESINIIVEEIDGTTKYHDSTNIILEDTPIIEEKTDHDIGIMATYDINWNVSANKNTYGTNQLNMSKGNTVKYNISWSPKLGVIRVGLYNRTTGEYYWDASSTTSPLNGNITVPKNGLYSFAVGNTTDTAVRVTGSYIY